MSPRPNFPVSPTRWDRVHTHARYQPARDTVMLTVSATGGGFSLELNPKELNEALKAITGAASIRNNTIAARRLG